jgi:hypothetical protein
MTYVNKESSMGASTHPRAITRTHALPKWRYILLTELLRN